MWRFYLIATVIVVAFGSVVFARRLATNDWKLRVDTSTTRPSAHGNGNNGFDVTPPPAFVGQGPWVLSALPSCFDQKSSIEGPAQALVFHIPDDRSRIRPGTTLHRGNCTVLVRNDDIWVYRGKDRLRVPPVARLYNGPEGLTLVYQHNGLIQVRVY